MTEFYYELYIQPSAYYELFADFILEHTNEAIEEIPAGAASLPSAVRAYKNDVILVRSEEISGLLEALEGFCKALEARLQERVSFVHASRRMKNQDWIENYRQSIAPLVVGGLYIRASWHPSLEKSEFASRAKEEIIIDPGLAFGSGHHASTSMCIEMLAGMDLKAKRVLDVGCGSGILALVAAKKGAQVSLCDVDELAVCQSQKNFKLNGEKMEDIWEGSMQNSGVYDVIVANILADIIKILYNDFSKATRKDSVLVLSGILDKYECGVLDCFRNFELVQRFQKEEWVALKLIKK